MANKVPIHVAHSGTVAATVYREDTRRASSYRVVVGKDEDGQAGFTPDELCMVRHAIEQADYFIRYQQQLAQMASCPGCGDG